MKKTTLGRLLAVIISIAWTLFVGHEIASPEFKEIVPSDWPQLVSIVSLPPAILFTFGWIIDHSMWPSALIDGLKDLKFGVFLALIFTMSAIFAVPSISQAAHLTPVTVPSDDSLITYGITMLVSFIVGWISKKLHKKSSQGDNSNPIR